MKYLLIVLLFISTLSFAQLQQLTTFNEPTYVFHNDGDNAILYSSTSVGDWSFCIRFKTTGTGNQYIHSSTSSVFISGSQVYWRNNTTGFTQICTTAVNDGSWHSLVVAVNNTTRAFITYLDGSLNFSGTLGGTAGGLSMSSAGLFRFDASNNSPFLGEAYDLRFFNRKLDATEAPKYHTDSMSFAPDWAWFKLCENTTDSVYNSVNTYDNAAILGDVWVFGNNNMAENHGYTRVINSRKSFIPYDISGNSIYNIVSPIYNSNEAVSEFPSTYWGVTSLVLIPQEDSLPTPIQKVVEYSDGEFIDEISGNNISCIKSNAFQNNNTDNVVNGGVIDTDWKIDIGFIFKPRTGTQQFLGSGNTGLWKIESDDTLVFSANTGQRYPTILEFDEDRFYTVFIRHFIDVTKQAEIYVDGVLADTLQAVTSTRTNFENFTLNAGNGTFSVKEVACSFLNKTGNVTAAEALAWRGNPIKGGINEILIPFSLGLGSFVYDVNNNKKYTIEGTVIDSTNWVATDTECNYNLLNGFYDNNDTLIPASQFNAVNNVYGLVVDTPTARAESYGDLDVGKKFSFYWKGYNYHIPSSSTGNHDIEQVSIASSVAAIDKAYLIVESNQVSGYKYQGTYGFGLRSGTSPFTNYGLHTTNDKAIPGKIDEILCTVDGRDDSTYFYLWKNGVLAEAGSFPDSVYATTVRYVTGRRVSSSTMNDTVNCVTEKFIVFGSYLPTWESMDTATVLHQYNYNNNTNDERDFPYNLPQKATDISYVKIDSLYDVSGNHLTNEPVKDINGVVIGHNGAETKLKQATTDAGLIAADINEFWYNSGVPKELSYNDFTSPINPLFWDVRTNDIGRFLMYSSIQNESNIDDIRHWLLLRKYDMIHE